MTTKKEVIEYLVEQAELPYEKVEQMNNYELFDAWLKYEGICGYTTDIIEIYRALYCQEENGFEEMEEYVLTESRCVRDSAAFRKALSIIKASDRVMYRKLIKKEYRQMTE